VRLEELDVHVPEELIAQIPASPRDSSRLMHLASDGRRCHRVFSDLPELLKPGDVLVFNDSKVLPARVHVRKPSGGSVELLFLRPVAGGALSATRWEVLARPSHRLRPGGELLLPEGERLVLTQRLGEGRWEVEAPSGASMTTLMEVYGRLPLPPYIKSYPEDPSTYQTVYAAAPGSAAAPTAGLHFTPRLLERLAEAGVKSARVTLHVGLDTFLPIREEDVEQHQIHTEEYAVTATDLETIRGARASGARVVAVGTTSTRVLETLAGSGALEGSPARDGLAGVTSIFITPGYAFKAVDVLLTNLHLPRSTVLALAMAFAGPSRIRDAYAEAVALRYRFFSFGDAMLIEKDSGGDPGRGAPDA
jgi:S-adenosylmethionine:tRNA ribosyltransferase-isomerase